MIGDVMVSGGDGGCGQYIVHRSGQHIVQRVWPTHCAEGLFNTLYRGLVNTSIAHRSGQ